MDVRELAVQKKRELKGFLTVGTKYELKDAHDLSVAYTPGVAEPCLRIKDNEAESFELTCRSNMVPLYLTVLVYLVLVILALQQHCQ